MVGTFNTANEHEIVKAINNQLEEPDQFWRSEEDRFVSVEALQRGADVISITMTRGQWNELLAEHFNRG